MEEGDADKANANEVKFEPGKGKGIQVPPAKKGFINLAAFGIQVGVLEWVYVRLDAGNGRTAPCTTP